MKRTSHRALVTFMVVAWTAAAVGVLQAQDAKPSGSSAPADKAEPKPAPKPAPPSVVSIVGCVAGTGAVGDPITLQNPQEGIAYRLTGTNMRAFVGKRVQIAGAPDSRRVKIVGGLTPSATLAGQAGVMDPSRAIVESAPLSTAGKADPPLPEFRVRSVKPVAGSCGK